MAKPIPLHPKHPERICWGCDRYCAADALACGNGSGRTQHPIETQAIRAGLIAPSAVPMSREQLSEAAWTPGRTPTFSTPPPSSASVAASTWPLPATARSRWATP
ncbi:hypothetical protein G6F59_017452 [Rhizopus arrhizus]|nr:hypothetical protein G6F59_017452 [Rhizopus arrhizus]